MITLILYTERENEYESLLHGARVFGNIQSEDMHS